MTVRDNYEVSVREPNTWDVRFADLVYATPTKSQPAAMKSSTVGAQLTGTIIEVDDAGDVAVVDFRSGNTYLHKIRNVLTYGGGPAEATFGDINPGDCVYYDKTATMPADVFLSTSPLDGAGNANPKFGYVVQIGTDTGVDTYPKGANGVASTQNCAIMQIGSGAS
jgi:hypothetical protein